MALGDITILQHPQGLGSRMHQVQSGAAASIKAGEPVAKALGSQYVAAMATNKPVVATDYLAGISASTSNDTAAADGTVEVFDILPGVVYSIKPKVAATWDTQAEYDALVGDRVLIDLTSSSYTILATDGATYGCVIENFPGKDGAIKFPGQVAFSLRQGLSYLA